jgi:hydrogenase maturation protein HypF
LRPFVLPGGERAVREPWRVAVSLVCQAAGKEEAARLRFEGVAATQIEQIVKLVCKANAGPLTSSAGRLFDGVAALALGVIESQFEGQPAMLLEDACGASAGGEYPLPLSEGELATLDWRPLVHGVLADRAAGVAPGSIAMRFHRALAEGIAAVVERFSGLDVVLGGGCFQNKMLAELAVERLGDRSVAAPGVIPSGDGGLAAGQLTVAAARLAGGYRPCV